jgi:4-amino-4-deoxy-L-arabinose transferase-like glycosyltransferase
VAVGIAILAGTLLSVRLNQPGWFDNEGRFAEMAREMILRQDFITPKVNGVTLLTKPPLTQWLAAAVYAVTGPSEWARLVPIIATMLTIFVTCRLGARLYDEPTGIVAGVMLTTAVGFVLEARTLRPDCLVVLAVTAAIFCWHVAETGAEARRTRWLVAMYAVLSVGMLAKGFVPPALAAIPIGIAMLRAHGLDGVRRLRPLMGLVLITVIQLPWHVAVALANPGFVYDYFVNQHVLAALGMKEPRDSEGDTLAFFLQAFTARAWPWVTFLPLAPAAPTVARGGSLLLWTWLVTVVGLFSLTPSRLEHYSLPALPAVALLAAGVWRRARMEGVRPGMRAWFATLAAVLLAGGVFGLLRGKALAAGAYWLPQAPGMMVLIRPAAATALFAGVLLAVAALARSATGIVAAWALGTVPFLAIVVRALIEAEALFSWRPVARALERVPAGTEIVFQAPIEYQIVGALDFYLGGSVTMLEPADGYVPPAYLRGRMQGMFISRDELERRWRSGRPVAIVSDPQKRRDSADGLAPEPSYVLDRFGDRWVLTNVPAESAR